MHACMKPTLHALGVGDRWYVSMGGEGWRGEAPQSSMCLAISLLQR